MQLRKSLFLIFFIISIPMLIFAQINKPTKTSQLNNEYHYPIQDHYAPSFEYNYINPFSLRDTQLIKQRIIYDPKTKSYRVSDYIGSRIYRQPIIYSTSEFNQKYNQQKEIEYFKHRSDILSKLNRRVNRPDFVIDESFYASPLFFNNDETNFGNLSSNIKNIKSNLENSKKGIDDLKNIDGVKIDFQLLGDVSITFGYIGTKSFNPNLAPNQRNIESFDFRPTYNINANVKIGDNFKLPFNLTNLNELSLDNQIKLSFKGRKNQIIKQIDLGNIAYESKSVLIPSTQNLFGIKSRLQFGKLYVTAVLATQNSNKEAIQLQGGSSIQKFSKKIDDYDENKHFLLGQYFKQHFSEVMGRLPQPNSKVNIQRIEVWVTTRANITNDVRYITAFMDLGESQPYSSRLTGNSSALFPDNSANTLYSTLLANKSLRDPTIVSNQLEALGFLNTQDFEKVYARKLSSTEYFFNQQAGFISLNIQLLPDDVIGVAYQFSYNGKTYQVGEFSTDVNPDTATGNQNVIFLKMLKSTAQRVDLPIWDLMMKNVYSLDFAGTIERTDFQLNVLYNEPGAGQKRYIPETDQSASGKSIIRLLNLDNLNSINNPQADGLFDFVEGYTILLNRGKIIFPYLEPFGKDLEQIAFKNQTQEIKDKYLFYVLYDSLKYFAQNSGQVNRFSIEGQAKGVSGEFTINAFNIPQGSVIIQVGGNKLIEGQDYIIDYGSGRGRIINPAYINNASTAIVTFENSIGINTQQKNFSALRLDYVENQDLTFGFTAVSLGGTPFFNKLNYGDDPIKNSVYGLDVSYRGQSQLLTNFINKLLPVKSKAPSFFTTYTELAYFKPGHPKSIGSSGTVYIDDFESSGSSIDLKEPFFNWTLASLPQGQTNLFPEANNIQDLSSNFNRAKLAWYKILPLLQQASIPSNNVPNTNPLRYNYTELNDPRVRRVLRTELFPPVNQIDGIALFQTFDLAYYPFVPGPYNFQTSPTSINSDGLFTSVDKSWGGIMRSIDQTDFETNNIEYIEFWVLDPFINKPNNSGTLYINIGNISEDILPDGKRSYEQGLPTPANPTLTDTSIWGISPLNPIQVINTFSTDPNDRELQDLGLDGLTDENERQYRQNQIQAISRDFGINSAFYLKFISDPSNDNYEWYLDPKFDATNTGVLRRYINFNNPQGNSPVITGNSNALSQATIYPDIEDLNRDNTLNENETYFQYTIPLSPSMNVSNSPYIYNTKVVAIPNVENENIITNQTWYQFRIPIRNFSAKIGNIKDFKAIRFIRLFLRDFVDTTVLRLATFNLLRNNWRPYTYLLDSTSTLAATNPNSAFSVGVVNIFEHNQKAPVNYLVPPGIQQQQIVNSVNNVATLNEQAIALRIDDLPYKENKAVFKTVNYDLRRYKKLQMFIHIESKDDKRMVNLQDNEVNAVIRIGQDAVYNYYEIKIPLAVTPAGYYSDLDKDRVWPTINNLDLVLQTLIDLKLNRNKANIPQNQIYRQQINNLTYSILGNPNIAEVNTIILGIENASLRSISCEVWFNELRLTDFVEDGSFAGLAKLDATLADVGTMHFSVNGKEVGFGAVDNSINQRTLDNLFQIDFATNLEMGKFLPKNIKMSIPVSLSVNKTTLTPKYDPLDKDVLAKDKISSSNNPDSVREIIIDNTNTLNLAINNLKILSNKKEKPIYSIANFDFSYSYSQINHTNSVIARDFLEKHLFSVGYLYSITPKYIQPFKKIISEKKKYLGLIHHFNFNFLPSNISYKVSFNRQFGEFVPRIINSFDNTVEFVDTTFNKFFTYNQSFNLKFNLTKSITLDFNSSSNNLIDEPFGRINTKTKRDSIFKNILKGGRTTVYNQKFNARYNLPFKYLPLIAWINANYTYSASFNWLGASSNNLDLGNTLSNESQHTINSQFNFEEIYNAVNFFKKAISKAPRSNKPKPKLELPKPIIPRDSALKGLTGKIRDSVAKIWKIDYKNYKLEIKKAKQKYRQEKDLNFFSQSFGGFITMFRNLTVDFNQHYQSNLPGYLGRSNLFSSNLTNISPVFSYAFGRDPTPYWLDQQAFLGLYTASPDFNLLITRTFSQSLRVRLQVEPIKYLTISFTLEQSLNKEYSELFKDTNNSGQYNHLSVLNKGGFRMTYTFLKSSSINKPINSASSLFRMFEQNRLIVAQRVAAQNPYWIRQSVGNRFDNEGFPLGYNKFSQEVLIPSFLAAYSQSDPNSVPLIRPGRSQLNFNPFANIIPFPNWQITYSGFSQIPAIKSVFNNISFRNSYISTLELGSFTSALLYSDPFNYGGPAFRDTVSGNYIPYFIIPNLTISERFEPFFGFDLSAKSFSFRFEYKKSRIFTLSLVDYQVSEALSNEYASGFSYQFNNLSLGTTKLTGTLKSNLVAKIDLSFRDSKRTNSRLEQNNAIGVEGQKELLISPSLDFIINNNFNVKIFFEQRYLTPYVSNNYPSINTRAGVTLRYSFR